MTAAAIIAVLLALSLASKRNRYRLRTKWRVWQRHRAERAWVGHGNFISLKHAERFRRAEVRHTEALLAERDLRAGSPEDFYDPPAP